MQPTPIATYHTQAQRLFECYEALSFEAVHGAWRPLLPVAPARILDVGAGSGRDAAWLARQGHRVTAVEPAAGLRRLGQKRHRGLGIAWKEGCLPGLSTLNDPAARFDLILLSAVWMHVPPAQRPSALARLAPLLAAGGLMVVTLRHGPSPVDRSMHPVCAAELVALAEPCGLDEWLVSDLQADLQGRQTVQWQTVCLRKR
jgi:SAM-dependent methyltransferase